MTAIFSADHRGYKFPALDPHGLFKGQIDKSGFVRPIEKVFASVAPGRMRGNACSQEHLAPALVQLFGDLRAGLTGSDYEHRARGERLRVAVSTRMELEDRWRNLACEGGCFTKLEPAGCSYDVASVVFLLLRLDQKAAAFH